MYVLLRNRKKNVKLNYHIVIIILESGMLGCHLYAHHAKDLANEYSQYVCAYIYLDKHKIAFIIIA